jgi:uncharacterized NAD-dependent epimerase/dehydratase family protein
LIGAAAVEESEARPGGDAAGAAYELPQPYLLFLGDVRDAGYAKTAFGLRDWAGDQCVGEYALAGATVTTGLPGLTPREAHQLGARALVIGVANSGGFIAESWVPALEEALKAGLDIVSGMHARLHDIPILVRLSERHGRKLIDIRQPPRDIPVASGRKRSGKRLLTVGTDCALGKKYSALAIARALAARGVAADFRATGQTGIMIAGAGIPMDAVVSDFAAGAAEMLTPDAADDHWDVIEGQGSLLHPAYAGVSLALLHGSQPDVIVVCHEAGREHVLGNEGYALPSIEEATEVNLLLGRRTNPKIRCGGVCLNTRHLSEVDAQALIASETARLGLPVADPVRGGRPMEQLIDSCLSA